MRTKITGKFKNFQKTLVAIIHILSPNVYHDLESLKNRKLLMKYIIK